ncbi:hypothetical protein CSA17_03570 [bacterium DOLJORAL78_65_58]|nr:MAG: hypothetical protein CSA17_03570 [bacterium DOLJORAL78_65_58]
MFPIWLDIVMMILLVAGWLAWFRQRQANQRNAALPVDDRPEPNPSPQQEQGQQAPPLQKNPARMIQGLEELGAELWEWDLGRKRVQVSPLILETSGYADRRFPSTPEGLLKLVYPEDRSKVWCHCRGLLVGRQSEITIKARFLFGDDTYHWVQTRVIPRRDDTGRVSTLVGNFQDITQRVAAEQERDRLFNLSIDMLAVWGFDGKLQQLNPAWVRVLGWSRDELMDRPLLFFVHPDDQDLTREALEAIYQGDPIDEPRWAGPAAFRHPGQGHPDEIPGEGAGSGRAGERNPGHHRRDHGPGAQPQFRAFPAGAA